MAPCATPTAAAAAAAGSLTPAARACLKAATSSGWIGSNRDRVGAGGERHRLGDQRRRPRVEPDGCESSRRLRVRARGAGR